MAATSIQGLYQRSRLMIHEGFKFLVIGALGTVVTIVGAVALHGLGKYTAVTIATVIGTIVTFIGNRYWTFRHRQGQGAAYEGVTFFLLNGVGLLIYYACIWLIQDFVGLGGRAWYAVALVLGTILGTIFRFWSYRKWVWAVRRDASQLSPPPAERLGWAHTSAGPVIRLPSGLSSPGHAPAHHGSARHAAPSSASMARPTARGRPGAHRRT